MAIFDNIVNQSSNFKGYTGNPPTTEEEYAALDCWKDASQAPSWDSVSSDMALLEVQRERKSEYPSMADQLDYIYHNGIAKWKSDMIKPVKAARPKPE